MYCVLSINVMLPFRAHTYVYTMIYMLHYSMVYAWEDVIYMIYYILHIGLYVELASV